MRIIETRLIEYWICQIEIVHFAILLTKIDMIGVYTINSDAEN